MNARQPRPCPDRKPAPPPPPPVLPLKGRLTLGKIEELYKRYSSIRASDWFKVFDDVFGKIESIGERQELEFARYVQGYIDGEAGKK
jgi:hypothetical protein